MSDELARAREEFERDLRIRIRDGKGTKKQIIAEAVVQIALRNMRIRKLEREARVMERMIPEGD